MSEAMSKLQRERMADRAFVGTDPEQTPITYTVKVSGGRAWLHREWEEGWDNEDGTGPDTGHDCWVLSLADLKKLVECATWTIQKSEAFEAAHPLHLESNEQAETEIHELEELEREREA
jgi:hypothetical protein